jgi:hemoglobin-like flavoprotein
MDEGLVIRLRESFEQLEPRGEELLEAFCRVLFERSPQVRAMFPEKPEDQPPKRLATLALAAGNLRSARLAGTLRAVGTDLIAYGAEPEHYAAVAQAMLIAMGEVAADAWSESLEEDWRTALGAVAGLMLGGAAAARRKVA